jgi:hypothetical protein
LRGPAPALAAAWIASVLATFVNPFGLEIYLEAFRHFRNPLLELVGEWAPFETGSWMWWMLVMWGCLVAAGLGILASRRQLLRHLPWIGPVVLLFILAFSVRMYAFTLYPVSIPVVRHVIAAIEPKRRAAWWGVPAGLLAAVYLLVTLVINPSHRFEAMSWERFCRQFIGCSDASIAYLEQHPPAGRLMTYFPWGGWLIWAHRSIRPSFDGRMPFWQDEAGYSAFRDYYQLQDGWASIDASRYDAVYMPPGVPLYGRIQQLAAQGRWRIVYQDPRAFVAVRVARATAR